MTTAFLIIFAPLFAFALGWKFGKNQIDPNTAKGRAYYASQKDRT